MQGLSVTVEERIRGRKSESISKLKKGSDDSNESGITRVNKV